MNAHQLAELFQKRFDTLKDDELLDLVDFFDVVKEYETLKIVNELQSGSVEKARASSGKVELCRDVNTWVTRELGRREDARERRKNE